ESEGEGACHEQPWQRGRGGKHHSFPFFAAGAGGVLAFVPDPWVSSARRASCRSFSFWRSSRPFLTRRVRRLASAIWIRRSRRATRHACWSSSLCSAASESLSP